MVSCGTGCNGLQSISASEFRRRDQRGQYVEWLRNGHICGKRMGRVDE